MNRAQADYLRRCHPVTLLAHLAEAAAATVRARQGTVQMAVTARSYLLDCRDEAARRGWEVPSYGSVLAMMD